ncbi:TPA: hypothetical protein U5E31_004051 [Yersinia enterocolitica]|uniref:hypothetical protein n=1 Tax=Yersinia enterocolitica TaxID=630 RepID=UPI00094B823A|nr:hypothetical protein [Yersinia enterocolitica]HDL8054487.1 hypothetical protein [Yersinia enterocolitica]HDM8436466.1 hypothetical protein [Yersinia enterocolitica]HEI6849666.1 hypothetical protein [Yersinia enterocolitica]HEN3577964.1 hypothetical protein [Yersinia enterocolitica]HEN3598834.1 hypothetical protein [Yersinia enterocolitica]
MRKIRFTEYPPRFCVVMQGQLPVWQWCNTAPFRRLWASPAHTRQTTYRRTAKGRCTALSRRHKTRTPVMAAADAAVMLWWLSLFNIIGETG